EVDRPRVLPELGVDPQHAGLPGQVEQLEDVVNAELAERPLDRHGVSPPIRSGCGSGPGPIGRASAPATRVRHPAQAAPPGPRRRRPPGIAVPARAPLRDERARPRAPGRSGAPARMPPGPGPSGPLPAARGPAA